MHDICQIIALNNVRQLKNIDEVEGEVAQRNEKILDEIKKLGTRTMAKMPCLLPFQRIRGQFVVSILASTKIPVPYAHSIKHFLLISMYTINIVTNIPTDLHALIHMNN